MSVMKIVGYAFLTLFLVVILREVGFRGARLVSLVGVVGLLSACVAGAESLGRALGAVGRGVPDEYAVAVMKIMGVGYASGICSDVCLELGEPGLSGAVSLFGRVEMLALCAPMALAIFERGIELMG